MEYFDELPCGRERHRGPSRKLRGASIACPASISHEIFICDITDIEERPFIQDDGPLGFAFLSETGRGALEIPTNFIKILELQKVYPMRLGRCIYAFRLNDDHNDGNDTTRTEVQFVVKQTCKGAD